MKKAKKILALLLCAVLLVGATVAGTLAFLTSQDEVTNTFTVGKVHIKLDEAYVDENGDAVDGDRVKQNEYHLLPGHAYDKDPTVTVLADSEECYVRMIMTINKQDELDEIFKTINAERVENGLEPITIMDVLTGFDATKWVPYSEKEEGNTRVYEFRYYQPVATSAEDHALEALFKKIVMPGEITNDQLATLYSAEGEDNLTINVVAHAIQTDSFGSDVDKAWTAFDGQN